MNRLQLEKEIIEEGSKRSIIITKCSIYDRTDCLEFYPEIQNNEASKWTYEHQVEELISDLAPLDRPHKINKIGLDKSRYNLFKIGDAIEVDNIWIRLDAGEKEPRNLISISSGCGQYRSGWMKGEVFEADNGPLGIKFPRDVYMEDEKPEWIGSVDNLERLIREDKIKKIEAGQPIWSGTHAWSIRRP